MATTTTALAMKIAVATIDRAESRATPHTPWPEVQPPPSRAPKPTRSPANAIITQLAGIRGAAARKAWDEDVISILLGIPVQARLKQQRLATMDALISIKPADELEGVIGA